MLPASPNPIVIAWWRWYCRFAIRKHFHRLMLYGAQTPPPPSDTRPAVGTLYLADHLSFWDGIVLYHVLTTRLGERRLRCMIDAEQVESHPFFRRVGGFSVDRTSPRDGLRACAHAADLLAAGHSVVIFPQGKLRPADAEVALERGFTYVLDRTPTANVVVASLRYDFWTDQRPEAMVRLSAPRPGALAGLDDITDALRDGSARLRDASLTRTPGEVLLTGRRPISSWRFPRPRPRR